MRGGVRETTNYTQTSPIGSTGQAYQFRYQRGWSACSRPVTQRGHALTHVQTQAKSTVQYLRVACCPRVHYHFHAGSLESSRVCPAGNTRGAFTLHVSCTVVILFTVNSDQFIIPIKPSLVPWYYCTVSAYLVRLLIPNLQL